MLRKNMGQRVDKPFQVKKPLIQALANLTSHTREGGKDKITFEVIESSSNPCLNKGFILERKFKKVSKLVDS